MNISDENLKSILITSQEMKEFDRGTLLNKNKYNLININFIKRLHA